MLNNSLSSLLAEARACRLCEKQLPFPPKPVLRASATAQLLIVGQAPGLRVHHTGIPWNDPSGDRLREWLQLDKSRFYDERKIAIIPTGLCYPGKGKNGDLPPRPECAPRWHPRLRACLPQLHLTLLIGQHAQRYYLGARLKDNLTATVHAWREYLPAFFPLPHPSPRNQFWLKTNTWFSAEILPVLREQVQAMIEEKN